MSFGKAALIWALLLCVSGAAHAYRTPPRVSLPWNLYVASRIPDGFSSIIGRQGTTLIPGSNNARIGNEFTFQLPFPFLFISQIYPAGSTLRTGPQGYIGFSTPQRANPNGVPYSLEYGPTAVTSFDQKVIAAYWSELQTAGVVDGGIYYRTDGTAPNRTLTVEWRAQGAQFPAGNPGNFQVKLYESNGYIEYFYGPNSIPRTRPRPTPYTVGYGAVIGIKNLGQQYISNTPPSPGNDAEKFLLFQQPDEIPDTVAITCLNTVYYAGYYTFYPCYYAYYPMFDYYPVPPSPPSSPYFFYDFPTVSGQRIGFRAAPVFNDVKVDSIWFTPSVAANAFLTDASVTINGRFRNMGGNSRQNIPVRADVYRNGTLLVTSLNGTAFPTSTAQFGTSDVTFLPPVSTPVTSIGGEYVVKVYAQYADDQDRSSDTLLGLFYISRQNDLAAQSVLQPFSNEPPQFTKYTTDVPILLELSYVNIGTHTQYNATVGYQILDAAGTVIATDSATVPGFWRTSESRTVEFTWQSSRPGRYSARAVTFLPGDENRANDTMPTRSMPRREFDLLYEFDVQAGMPGMHVTTPLERGSYPDGKPVPVALTFLNDGVSDATNVPATVQIRDANRNLVYNRTVAVPSVTPGGRTLQSFPSFVPMGPGEYCVTAFSNHLEDRVRGNDTVRWCFNVKPRLTGLIRVGFGERFRTIQEARDSLFNYGVSGPVIFELVDNTYTIEKSEPTIPALDFRGRVVGMSPTNTVTWRPVAGKSDVRVNLRTGSGIGIWYGQLDTSNPSGYITWDGGSNRALRFVYENIGSKDVALPFLFGQGASNYAIKNARIEPATDAAGRKQATALPIPGFNQSQGLFTFASDLDVQVSAGIMMRNSAPVDPISGINSSRRDTLVMQNNVVENCVISGFGYGVVSIGAGPLFVVGQARYVEYANTNTILRGNEIRDVGRAGIAVAFDRGTEISGNVIRNVDNTSAVRGGAVGIWATAGGNASGNRGYSTDLKIERNRIYNLTAAAGTASAILLETSENQLVSPANVVFRFPANGNSNMRVWNNFGYNYSGAASSIGIGLTVDPTTRVDFLLTGNRIENNTIHNQIAGASTEMGITVRGGASIRNNIISLVSPTTNPTALVITAADYKQTVTSDYNLFWVPNGNVGRLNIQHVGGQPLPSPAVARTLQQWRALTGLDINSAYGDVTPEFVSIAPGSTDLHIKTTVVGALANNRGMTVTGMTNDIDHDPRGASALHGRYDIGADEFNGLVRNNDLQAEEITAPFGYRAATGQFSDAEYVMLDSLTPLKGVARNVGGMPLLSNAVTLTIECWNGTGWTSVQTIARTASIDVSGTQTLDFGSFMPRTLRELGMNDQYFGAHANVTPRYRFTLKTGADDNASNDLFQKQVRFYVQRSVRKTMVAVEGLASAMPADPIAKGNKLNADSLLAALKLINWSVTGAAGTQDYDLFERDRWPQENLNFTPWKTMIWAQGEEAGGLAPEERAALKRMLESRTAFDRANLIIAGQEVARQHDVQLGATNGALADLDFTRNYLRSQYMGSTVPADYSNRRIGGVRLTPGAYEQLVPTGVAGDLPPMPAVLRVTSGNGLAGATHRFVDQTIARGDSSAGIVSAPANRNVIYYGFDWRHAGRYVFEPGKSGVQRLLLAALDWTREFNGAVPVTLVRMDAYQSGRRAVTVDWQTASEVEVVRMEIERSAIARTEAGISDGPWTVVDRKSPEGNVTKGSTYRAVDDGVESGREYAYRLVTVGADGQRTVEEVRLVKIATIDEADYDLSVWPNPVTAPARVTVGYRAPAGARVRLVLYDVTGREVTTLADEQSAGSGSIVLDVSELPSMVYSVRLESMSRAPLVRKLTVRE